MDIIKKSFVLLIIICFSCNDNIQLKKEDVIKYDWLQPFLIEIKSEFEGIHNVDKGILKFNYSIKNPEEIILKLDNVALVENWTVNKVNDSTRIFTKNILIYGETLKKTNILVNFHQSENKLYFNIN